MGNRLKGKVAVVTGAGRGMGRTIALTLAREGARVVTNDRQPGSGGGDAEDTAREIIGMGGQAVAFYGDIADFEVARRLIQTAAGEFGGLHILVNNAGVNHFTELWDMSEEEWDEVIGASLKGTFNCTRHACGLMREQKWGRVINVTSGARLAIARACHYAAAKAGIVGFTRAVAMDMAKYGVTCNAYQPYARTTMLNPATPEFLHVKEERLKQGKITQEEYEWQMNPPGPEAVGEFVAYLATEESNGINGRVFYVSGGKVAIYSEPERIKTMIKKEGFWTVEELIRGLPNALVE